MVVRNKNKMCHSCPDGLSVATLQFMGSVGVTAKSSVTLSGKIWHSAPVRGSI